MRLAHLLPRFPAPSETFIHAQMAALLARGHALDVYTFAEAEAGDRGALGPDAAAVLAGARMVRVRLPRGAGEGARLVAGLALTAPRRLVGAIRPWRHGRWALSTGPLALLAAWTSIEAPPYDVVHAQYGTVGRLALALADESGAALVTSFRGFDLSHDLAAHGRGIYRQLFARGSLFLPVCELFRGDLERLGAPPGSIRVHRSGIPVARFPFLPPRAPGNTVRLVSVGRLLPMKGVDVALRTVRLLVDGGLDVCYDVVGDGPERRALEELAQALDLTGRVRFHGLLPPAEVALRLQRGDVFLHPARTTEHAREGIPNAIKEAMATGLPVVAAAEGGIPEIVVHGKTGLLVRADDPADVAAAVRHLLETPGLAVELARRARTLVEQDYDAGPLALELEALYRGARGTQAPDRP